jgi:hypothetical protein
MEPSQEKALMVTISRDIFMSTSFKVALSSQPPAAWSMMQGVARSSLLQKCIAPADVINS